MDPDSCGAHGARRRAHDCRCQGAIPPRPLASSSSRARRQRCASGNKSTEHVLMRYLRLLVVALILCGIGGYAASPGWRMRPRPKGAPARPSTAAQPPGVAIVSATAAVQECRRCAGRSAGSSRSTVTVRARVDGEVVQQLVQEGQTSSAATCCSVSTTGRSRRHSPRTRRCSPRDQATLARTRRRGARPRSGGAQGCGPAAGRPDRGRRQDRRGKRAGRSGRHRHGPDPPRLHPGTSADRGPRRRGPGDRGQHCPSVGRRRRLVTITQMKPLRVSFTLPDATCRHCAPP